MEEQCVTPERFEALYDRAADRSRMSRREAWDRRAEDWDSKYRRESERREHERRILDLADWLRQRGLLGGDCDVADIGCGPGRFVAEFAKTSRSVLGVDISPNMTGYGEAYCAEQGFTNTRFLALDFPHVDVAALGLERRFDLAFSSITPALSTVQGLNNLIRISRGWCFNASFVYSHNPLQIHIMRSLFGREPRRDKTGHSHWFYEMFSLLWQRGYYPETHYYQQLKSVPQSADLATARRLTEYLLEEDEVTEANERRILRYLEEHANADGIVFDDSECRFGWLIWNVNERTPRA